MEQLHSKLHDTYKNLKKRKFFEEDETQQKRFSSQQNYQQDIEDLLDFLNSENNRLHNEMSSLQKKYEESQKLLHEKSKETKELSSEVLRLQELLAKKDEKVEEANQNVTPGSSKSHRLSRSTCAQEEETDKNVEHIIQQNIVPSCCRRTLDNNGDMNDSISCVLHSLVETLLDMKVSIDSQSEEESRLSVTHEKSGYAFSLTWAKNGGELTYRVSSLGTLEQVASLWMKEEIIFSMNMCSMFFDRLSHVISCAN
ncbi:hypothetical protein LUZ60_014029 [Juncus effusus]|nr:hypothetical protein LUZ60_014029 [Juncus effusus]